MKIKSISTRKEEVKVSVSFFTLDMMVQNLMESNEKSLRTVNEAQGLHINSIAVWNNKQKASEIKR